MKGNDHWSEFRNQAALKARLGITITSRIVQVGSGRNRGNRLAVEISLPRRQKVLGRVLPKQLSLGDRLRGVFRRSSGADDDPATADFARLVDVQPQAGSETIMDRFFELPVARRAALELIRMGCKFEFTPTNVRADASCLCHPPKLPDPQEVATRLAAIAAPLVARQVIRRRGA